MKKLDKVFVVDVEATCWETREEQGTRPNEVIEIGICTLDMKSGIISNGGSYQIKPRFTTVSPFCTELTGWTQADMDTAPDVQDVLKQISHDYRLTKAAEDNIWFSCGEYDRVKLSSTPLEAGGLNLLYGIPREVNPFALMKHANIKTLFALKHKLSREKGMAGMLKIIGENLDGRHHNGMADAMNIAKIVRHVFA